MMNKWIVSTVLAMPFLYGFAQSTADVDFNLVSKNLEFMNPIYDEGTARYAAMAGSMGALGGDISSININPAGSGFIIDNSLSATMAFTQQSIAADLGTHNNRNESYFGFNQLGGVIASESDNRDWKRINIGLMYDRRDLRKRIVFGKNPELSAFDYDAEGNLVDEYLFEGYRKSHDGKKEKITINVGTNYKNKFYFGANFNLHSYRVEYEHNYFGHFEQNNETISFRDWSYPYSEEASGLSFGIGGIYRPTPTLRLGLAFQSATSWSDIQTTYDEYYYDENSGLVDSYVGEGFWDQDRARSAAFLNLSAGAVVKKSLALNFDYIRHFISFNEYKPLSDYTGTNNFLENYTQNVNEFRLGAEYKYRFFKFRAGYAHVSSPTKAFTLSSGYIDGGNNIRNESIPHIAQGKRQLIGLGIGYEFKTFYLDFAYQQHKQKYQTLLTGTHVDPGYYPLDFNTYIGEVSQKRNNFILTFGYTF